MAITAFQTNTETKLAQMAADLLALTATFDDGTAQNENAQILTWFYQLVKVIRVRQRHAVTTNTGTAKDRIGDLVGGHTAQVLMYLASEIDEVYNEMFTLFNSVDDPTNDSPFGTNLGDNGTGPVGGPLH